MPPGFDTSGNNGPRRIRLMHSATIAFISVLCIVLVSHDLFRTWEDRSRRLDESRQEVANLALFAGQHAEDAFRLASTSLSSILERVEVDGTGPAQIERLRRVMAQRLSSLPILQSMSVIDETGISIVDALPVTPRTDVTDREYFRYHRAHQDRQPYVSDAIRSKLSGKLIVVVSQRIERADGSFAGVVTATIDVASFQDFYATFDLGQTGSAALFRDDGTLLIRRPIVQSAVGTRRLSSPPFNDLSSKALSGISDIISPVDGMWRIYAWRRVTGYPLVVGVALGRDEQLAVWRVGAVEHLLAGVAVALLLGFVAVRLVEQVRLLTQAEQETAAANAAASTAAAQYRLLADNSSDMIVTMDMQYRRHYVSPGCRDMLGYEPEELIGGSPLSFAHPDDAQRVAACLNGLVAGEGRGRITYRVRHRDGNWLWVDFSYKLIRDPDTGAPLEIHGSMRDFTERTKALTALQASEERFRLLLQSSAITEAIYLLDHNGNVESWGAGAERMKGYLPKEIIGRHFSTFFTPEDIASGEPANELSRAATYGTFANDAWRVRKDGSRFLAHVVTDLIRSPDGSPRGFIRATSDITNQRIEEEQRAIIIEAAPNGMLIVDEAGIITLANSAVERIFGYPDGTLIRQPLEVLVPEGFRAAHGVLRSAFTSGRSDRAMAPEQQFTGRKRNGSPVTIEIMLSPVKTPRGRIVVAALFDVTDRTRLAAERQESETRERLQVVATNAALDRLTRHLAKARDRAEKANRAKSRFLAGMSHELRTPLNGILGYAHLLHIEGGLNPAQSARVDAMLEAGKHLLEMITCVLDLSEIEADHLLLRPVRLNLQAIAAACLDLVRPSAQASGLTLSIAIVPGTPPELVADPTRLRQILLNLLGNAVKFTKHGSVELRLRQPADISALRIEVVDTGPGISAEQRQRLFQDFERLDAENVRTVEGAGLGLALSARLASLMGGSLGYEDNLSGGSIFWVELPLDTAAELDLAMAPGLGVSVDEASRVSARAYHVLVVDDVLMNRDIAGSFLRSAGHTVICVADGADGVAAAARSDFDVVLMDVRMPGMDGLEATRRIRRLTGARGRVPIVALTAQAFTEQIAACHAAGMNSHLPKPFDPDTLLAAVVQAVSAGLTQATDLVVPVPNMVPAVIGSELPVINRGTFEQTASFLTPEAVASHLQTIVGLGDDLLQRLRVPDAVISMGSGLVDGVHSLAGSAGMFGFERLATMGRRFERAIQSGSAEVPALGDSLAAALEATLLVIHDFTPVAVAT